MRNIQGFTKVFLTRDYRKNKNLVFYLVYNPAIQTRTTTRISGRQKSEKYLLKARVNNVFERTINGIILSDCVRAVRFSPPGH